MTFRAHTTGSSGEVTRPRRESFGGRRISSQYVYLNLGVCILLRVLDQVQRFPSNTTLFQLLFTILFKLSATCFGCTTIFKWKCIHLELKRLLKLGCLHPVACSRSGSGGFRLTPLYVNFCLRFFSNYPLHVSVVRPSSGRNIYIGN
jgi:hypothetical protein